MKIVKKAQQILLFEQKKKKHWTNKYVIPNPEDERM